MIIQYYVRDQFGRVDKYPVNKDVARAICFITGSEKGVLSDRLIQGFKILGVEFEEVTRPKNI